MAYATVDDLTDYMAPESPPSDATRVLARASEVVDRLLIGSVYDVDDDDLPTDTYVASALLRATCAQAAYMAATSGSEFGLGSGNLSSVSVGSISYSFRDTGSTTSMVMGLGSVSPNTVGILRGAGLLPVRPWSQ